MEDRKLTMRAFVYCTDCNGKLFEEHGINDRAVPCPHKGDPNSTCND